MKTRNGLGVCVCACIRVSCVSRVFSGGDLGCVGVRCHGVGVGRGAWLERGAWSVEVYV
jgi:hypothetical protein